MVYRYLFILILPIWISGCGGTLKRGWTNFTTYYNTYYNAHQYFEAGRKEARNQTITLDPSTPVRIHHSPQSSGSEAFEKAIEKCVLVLQKHSESKWADDALLLMGKSHYYEGDFIAAIERFEELNDLDADNSLRQKATIWKGKALLGLNDYEEGIAYLEPLLQSYPREWDTPTKGELQALVAEYHALLGNWGEALVILSKALSNISGRELLGRSYFLYGQVLEREERFGEALYAYQQVPSYFLGTEYTYWSYVKQADVARKQGNLEAALEMYRRLNKNDKYLDRRTRLTFKMGQTLQEQGKPGEAEELYRTLLYGEGQTSERSLQADIYYHMGKVYSDAYQKFTLASAYFDTSSSLRSQDDIMPDSTGVYRQYANLKISIERADSLLWLGSLPAQKLDSVIAKIKYDQRRQLQAERKNRVDNSLQNEPFLEQGEGDSTQAALYGFLNHRNQNVLEQGKQEFRILWGDRPLADNWRRQQALNESAAYKNRKSRSKDPEAEENQNANSESLALDLNLDAIPKTEEERQQLRRDRLRAQYQLGNIFQLNLNKPDSAQKYYHQVVESEIEDEVRPRAMYALYELANARSDVDSMQHWQEKILDDFPNSEIARLLAPESEQRRNVETDSSRLRDAYQLIQTSSSPLKGARLRSLALENQNLGLASAIHFRAIEAYIEKAQIYGQIGEILYPGVLNPDSVAIGSVGVELSIPLLFEEGDYHSIHWDSVRTMLAEHDSLFSGISSYHPQVITLQQELKISGESSAETIPRCNEMGVSLEVLPSMQQFMDTVNWPDDINTSSLSGEVIYEFVISPDGEIQSYSLVSPSTTLGIEEALEVAFEQSLQFERSPDGEYVTKLNCEIAFPINL